MKPMIVALVLGSLLTVALFTEDARSAGVIFDSSWNAVSPPVADCSDYAVTDGGKWSWRAEFNNGTGVHLLCVVPEGVNGHNALRVQQLGQQFAGNVQKDDFMDFTLAPTDYYVRYYMKNDDISEAGDHVVTVDTWNYWNLTFMRKYSGANDWAFDISVYGGTAECPAATWPRIHWGPPDRLARGQWYRFEYFVDFVASNPDRIQVSPQVYDAADNLLFTAADFRQKGFGSPCQPGPDDPCWGTTRSTWTLAEYYAANYSFCIDDRNWMNDFGMGNNGQQGSIASGMYWYYSAVEIRDDTWPGSVLPRTP